jgi:hypothetical protein
MAMTRFKHRGGRGVAEQPAEHTAARDTAAR